MTAEDTVKEIRQFCKANSDRALVEKYSRYFREGFKSYGVSQEKQNEKINELAKRSEVTLEFIFELSEELVPDGWYEEVSFPILLLEKKKKNFSAETLPKVGNLFNIGIDNWAHTDFIGGRILTYILVKGIIQPEDLKSWLGSERKFKRRVVPVSLIKSMKISKNISWYLTFLEPLMSDKERVVHQGMGWFLREAWKVDPVNVEDYLMKYRNTAPRLIFQYATEKMDKEYRLKFRRDKS